MSDEAQSPRPPPWAGGLIAVIAISAWSFSPLIFEGHTLYTSDVRHYHTPMLQAWIDAVSNGHLPLWTDHTYLGFPLIGDPQMATFYPGTPLVAWLGPGVGYPVLALLHLWIAAGGAYLLTRALGGAVPGGIAAGVIVSHCGFFAHEIQHPGLLGILAWMPWWWWATVRVFRAPGPGAIVAVAGFVAAMLFAGTLQVLLGALFIYALFVSGFTLVTSEEHGYGAALTRLALVGAGNLLGLGLAAVVIAPAVAHLPLTARALGMTYAFASMGSLHPNDLIGLAIPGYAQTAAAGTEALDFATVSFYMGLLTVPLAVVGFAALDRRLAACIAVGIGFLLWLGMGRHGALHPWLFEHWPAVFEGFRGMSRALGPVSILLAVAAGLGVARLATRFSNGRVVAWVLVSVVAIDVMGFGPLRSVLRENPLAEDSDPSLDDIEALRQIAGPQNDRLLLHGFGPLNLPLRNGVDGVGGYNPLVPLAYLDFVFRANGRSSFPREPIEDFVSGAKPQRFGSALVDAAAIRHVVTNRHDRTRGLQGVSADAVGSLRDHGAALYLNPDALPRAYLSHRSVAAQGLEAVDAQLGRGFDPRVATVVEGAGPALQGEAGVLPLSVRETRPEHKSVEVQSAAPGIVVLADAFHSGWRATVDGESAPVFRVNGMFMGVAVPTGSSRVVFTFAPVAFRVGAVISVLALGVSIVLAVLARRSPGRAGSLW